jgi:hypothetical protein
MANKFYKREKRGALSSKERNLVAKIESLVDQNDVDVNELGSARNVDQLEVMLEALEEEYGSTTIESSSPKEEPTNFEEPKETKPVESSTEQVNVPKETGSYELSQFVSQENSHPFAIEFESAGRDYAKGGPTINPSIDESEQNLDDKPVENTESSRFSESATDSVASPWDVPTDKETEFSSSRIDTDNVESDDPEKTALAESTKKKATKHIAKQAANLYAIVTEKLGGWAGKISDKKLEALEEEGKIDREYVVDKGRNLTIQGIADNHNSQLKKMVKLDDDVKDDFQEALELVMEKHQFEVTPEVNLAIVTISGIATVVKTATDLKKDTMELIEKSGKNAMVIQNQLERERAMREDLQRQIEEMKNGSAILESNTESPQQQTQGEVKEMSFVKKTELDVSDTETVQRNRSFSDSENMIETITSPVIEEKPKLVGIKKKKK